MPPTMDDAIAAPTTSAPNTPKACSQQLTVSRRCLCWHNNTQAGRNQAVSTNTHSACSGLYGVKSRHPMALSQKNSARCNSHSKSEVCKLPHLCGVLCCGCAKRREGNARNRNAGRGGHSWERGRAGDCRLDRLLNSRPCGCSGSCKPHRTSYIKFKRHYLLRKVVLMISIES